MADASPPFSQPHHHQPKSNFPLLYYGFVVVGTAALVLLTYNLIIIRWCTDRHSPSPARPGQAFSELPSSWSSEIMNRNLLSSFKYKKEVAEMEKEEDDEYECAVCLSVFEEGEEVKKLPRCTHSFHALCIDMWLYSHSDCPLCRAPVACYHHTVNSRPSLPDSSIPV